MLFNSINFAIFLPIVFILYWIINNKSLKAQNILLLIASYFFYACWNYKFLFLLIFSTFLDYFTGLKMYDAKKKGNKKFWFWLSIIVNLGFLAFFKYYNFFIDSFASFISGIGFQANFWTLKVILPVGISFYTFHGLSYVIDIYYNRIVPTRNFIDYSVFVSFFPLLVAGPIERATHLLPQIEKRREFNYLKAVDGLRQILWGLFKKIVIADNCAEYANLFFNDYADYSGGKLFLGAVFFSFQIYCDFSGYSDIALGTARLFGIELLRNFAYPYFSRDIAEFWRRWHISLSSWFKDYLYIPLGGNSLGLWGKVRNTFIIFIVSGFWHGANYTFVFWGFLNALYFLPLLLTNNNRKNTNIVAEGKIFPSIKEFLQMILTFVLTTFAWIFFRAETMNSAVFIVHKILLDSTSLKFVFDIQYFLINNLALPYALPMVIIFFFTIEWIGRSDKYAIEKIVLKKPVFLRFLFYYSLVLCIFWFAGKEQQFIYFEF